MPLVKSVLDGIEFEWDSAKDELVQREHNVTFEECCSIFLDFSHVTIPDVRFDDGEQRYITIGISNHARLVVVAWTQRGDCVRLISGRKADKKYEQRYNTGY